MSLLVFVFEPSPTTALVIYVGPHLYNFLFCKIKILICKIKLILQCSGTQFVEFSKLQIKLHEFVKKCKSKNQFSDFGFTKIANSMSNLRIPIFFWLTTTRQVVFNFCKMEKFILQIRILLILKFAKLVNLICKFETKICNIHNCKLHFAKTKR